MLPRPVVTRRIARAATLCALALAAAGVAGCGAEEEGHGHEAHREGLRVELGGLQYNVFLTRQLNPASAADQALYDGPGAEPGRALYGVFLEVCNREGEEARPAARDFTVRDNQGEEFEPTRLPRTNHFAYHPRVLGPRECIPRVGSVAHLGAQGGAMLLFDLPLEATENRPLVLEISSPVGDPGRGTREEVLVELDI